jgi:hypothetical protein
MAQNLRSVSVVFQAFTDKFEKSVDKAGNKMVGFGKKVVGAFAGFVAAKASMDKLSNSFERLDRLGKLSERLQMDPGTLRGLELAATQMGMSFEGVEKGVQRMARTIGEARQGITTGTTALKDIGMAAEDFDGKTIEDQFLIIADKIAAIEDPTRQAAVAFRIFGRQGQEMLNLLNQGSEGIKAFADEAERLGGPLSDEDLNVIEEANDAMDRLGKAFSGIFDQIAVRLAPALTMIADLMTELLVIGQEIFEAWDAIQGTVENIISDLFFDGMGKDIELGGKTTRERADLSQLAAIPAPAAQAEQKFNLRSFAEAADFQSEKAFNVLNPNRAGSVQNQQLSELKQIKDAVVKQADSQKVEIIKKDIR